MPSSTDRETKSQLQQPAATHGGGTAFSVARRTGEERIVMGIDPGTNLLGYGVLKICGRRAEMVAMGVIDLRRVNGVYLKLGRIYERVNSLIEGFLPDELSIESQFYGKNPQSMLKLGRAQGVAIAAAINRDVPIHEYAPLKIKMAITGNGRASKEQVAAMLQRYLSISDSQMLPYLDATDALAAAYCHFIESYCKISGAGVGTYTMAGSLSDTPGTHHTTRWADFVKSNPARVATPRAAVSRVSTSPKAASTAVSAAAVKKKV